MTSIRTQICAYIATALILVALAMMVFGVAPWIAMLAGGLGFVAALCGMFSYEDDQQNQFNAYFTPRRW